MIECFFLSTAIPGEWVREGQNFRENAGLDFENGYVVFTDPDVYGRKEFSGHLETFKNMSGNEGMEPRKPNPALLGGAAGAGIPNREPKGTGDVNVKRREEAAVPGGEGLEGFDRKKNSPAQNEGSAPKDSHLNIVSGIHFAMQKQWNFLVNTSVLLLN